jgi:hypothetical protein
VEETRSMIKYQMANSKRERVIQDLMFVICHLIFDI